MSRRFDIQDATGVTMRKSPVGVMYVVQPTTPTNGQSGYGTGCVWVNTAGTVGTVFYVNTGTKTSSTWTNVV